jgi:hypothetical protein
MATTTGWLGKLKKILSRAEAPSSQVSRVEVEYDAGFGNQLYIRGEGGNLSWEKGTPMTNVDSTHWAWETKSSSQSCVFKILINDVQYEVGENHTLTSGGTLRYTPRF